MAVAHNNKGSIAPVSSRAGSPGTVQVASEPDTSGGRGADKFEKSKHFMN